MPLPNYRTIDVMDSVNGRIGVIQKKVAEKFIHRISYARWLGNRGNLSGTPTVVISDAGANAPTAVAAAAVGHYFQLTVDAGAVTWDTDGQGTITITATAANGEKHVLIIDYKIVA
jgi:hypothetical protein